MSQGYGFVDFYDHHSASNAIQQLNGRVIYDSDIKVNWAYAGGHSREDTSNHMHVFVGDLSPDIDDRALWQAFAPFGSLSDARVMWDQATGRSRGFGFVSFRTKEDAEHAIREMNGEWLGSRAIRVNWANQKSNMGGGSGGGGGGGGRYAQMDLNAVMAMSSPVNTTVYIGNLPPEADENHLRELFAPYGVLEELRMQRDRGFAFARYNSHDGAARAIVANNGKVVGSKSLKVCASAEYPRYENSSSS
jgi:nucleolysin TIA-1/TIAR